jgi:hypothetical protein
VDKAELDKLQLEALRTLAVERGVNDAALLERAELIARLSPRRTSLVERAREAVAHAVERVEEKAHELADRVRHRHDEPSDAPSGPHPGSREPPPALGVPSSTVHLHAPWPDEPTSMLDFEELPEVYGVDECELTAKDPAQVFAWWEVTEAGLDGARAQLGQSAGSAHLVLRLFTTVPVNGHVEREISDVALSWNHGRRYLQAPRPGAHLRIAVGLLSKEGYFAPIAHSSLVRVPPSQPQPGPVEWMEVVPARRGRGRDPLVIVRRGAGHDERGLPAPGNGGGSSPGPSGGGVPWAGPSSSPTGGKRGGGDSGAP